MCFSCHAKPLLQHHWHFLIFKWDPNPYQFTRGMREFPLKRKSNHRIEPSLCSCLKNTLRKVVGNIGVCWYPSLVFRLPGKLCHRLDPSRLQVGLSKTMAWLRHLHYIFGPFAKFASAIVCEKKIELWREHP